MKAFFLSRVLREKVLLLALVLIAALMWLTGVVGRARTFSRDHKNTTQTLREQQIILDSRAIIEARAAAAIAQLDPASTFDAIRLQAEIDTLVTAAGITNKTIDTPRTNKTTQFSMNTTTVTLRNVDYASTTKFYEELKKRSPYIGLEKLSMQPVGGNVNQLTVQLTVFSVEVAKEVAK